jgi:hypothetical protein
MRHPEAPVMVLVEWKDDFALGVEEIDEEH